MKVLITGANGFVGRSLTNTLRTHGIMIMASVRSHQENATDYIATGSIDNNTNWHTVLKNCRVVIHLASRVHMIRDVAPDPLTAFRHTNTAATLNLAQQAATAGVRRFIFLSSIKVNGEGRNTPYTEHDTPNPTDPYAISKWEAEQGLHRIAAQTGMEVVILRPPLIYGVGVKANFLRLLQWVERGIPLPFGTITNQRSLLYIGNLVDAIRVCVDHHAAANRTFLVSDNEALSTAALIREMAYHFQRHPRLLNIPQNLLMPLLSIIGRKQEAERLLGSLILDNSLIKKTLDWNPPFSVQAGLKETIVAYRNHTHV